MTTAPRSSAKNRIYTAALEHFVVNGYDGASLNNIAEMVGIRKASLYAHFKSKDELFQQLLEDALSTESAFVESCFALNKNSMTTTENPATDPMQIDRCGQAYCQALRERYIQSMPLRFLIRTAYVPPVHLMQHIKDRYQDYIDCLIHAFQAELQQYIDLPAAQQRLYSDAYVGVIDSLHVDLLYSGLDNFDRRLQSMLYLLELALKQLRL
ncbi:TetR family transcriptional regulator [Acinetobacter calcoaceticus]|uniref:TetR family transcriptional regulator n=1 Tax=Acinetobacter calcoaceticus TaxID=471 RepID=A0A4R1XT51_ACICA|nr:TetR family transcriptional regulator [Acinetobacter calcoaceticus]